MIFLYIIGLIFTGIASIFLIWSIIVLIAKKIAGNATKEDNGTIILLWIPMVIMVGLSLFFLEQSEPKVKTFLLERECKKDGDPYTCKRACRKKYEDKAEEKSYCSSILQNAGKEAYRNEQYKEAGHYFLDSCYWDNIAESCFLLAELYESNKIDPNNNDPYKRKPADLYEVACSLKLAPACNNLGVKYQYGENGVRIDKSYATELYEQACNLGDKEYGCTNAGIMYKYGDGVFRDKTKAFELLKKGCIAGSEKACREKDDLLN